MDFSLLSPRKRTVNIDINDHSIRFVELKHANSLSVHRWGERFLPPGIISDGKITDYDSLSNIMEECIDEWKIGRRPIRYMVPDSLVIIRKISIPADVKDDEVHGYLFLEIGSSIHLPFENPVFDVFPLTGNGKTKELLLFAAPEIHVMQYANLFSELKLNPVAADISPLALYRFYYLLDQSHKDEILFTVQFDLTSVNMCIFENTIPFVMRQFPIPYDVEKWEIMQKKNAVEYNYLGDITIMKREFEDIFHEIRKLMDFYRYSINNGKKEVTKFLISGDHPMLDMIFHDLKERFELPVRRLNPGEAMNGKNGMIPYPFYLSLGLALKEVR